MIQVPVEFLASVLGTEPGDLTEALKEGEEFKPWEEVQPQITEMFENRIHGLKRQVRDEHYSRGKRESLSSAEKALREKYGLEGSGQLEDLVEELLNKTRETVKMNPDDVRNSDVYLEDIKKLKGQLEALKNERQEIEQKYRTKEVLGRARELGDGLLAKHKFAVPEDEGIRSNLMKLLYNSLLNGESGLKVNDQGDLEVIDKDGQRLMDQNTVDPVKFEDYFVTKAKNFFQVKQSDDRESPGNQGGKPPEKPGAVDKSKLLKQMYAERDPEKKRALAKQLQEA